MSNEPLVYRLTHSTGTVDLALDANRLVVKTKGTGALDSLRVAEIALADLRHFCLTPTIRAQNPGDVARDAELIVSWKVGGRKRKKRVFVASRDPALLEIVGTLRERRPDASLLDLPPKEAYAKIGVLSPRQGILVVVAIVLGVPVLIVVAWLLAHAFLG